MCFKSFYCGIVKVFLTAFIIFTVSCSAQANENKNGTDSIKIALLGDSMTWIGGESFDKPVGWTSHIKNQPVEMRLYARSGATWTNTSTTKADTRAYSDVLDPDNVIYNQVLRLISDKEVFSPDIILIYAGANDAWFSSRRPGMMNPSPADTITEVTLESDPSAFNTLASSINLSSKLLNQFFPNSKIVFLTPVHAGKISPESIRTVGEKIEATAELLGIETLRGDLLIPFIHDEETGQRGVNTYDGVHSNEKGAQLIADCIINYIILPQLQ